MDADTKKYLDRLEKKIDALTEKMEEIEGAIQANDPMSADQLTGTSRKLDEILDVLKSGE